MNVDTLIRRLLAASHGACPTSHETQPRLRAYLDDQNAQTPKKRTKSPGTSVARLVDNRVVCSLSTMADWRIGDWRLAIGYWKLNPGSLPRRLNPHAPAQPAVLFLILLQIPSCIDASLCHLVRHPTASNRLDRHQTSCIIVVLGVAVVDKAVASHRVIDNRSELCCSILMLTLTSPHRCVALLFFKKN